MNILKIFLSLMKCSRAAQVSFYWIILRIKKVRLQLNVYQKNTKAISFYQREEFIIQCEGLDEATGEKEYTMLWKQKQKSEFYGED